MHEKLADIFEGLLTVIVWISGIVLALMFLAALGQGRFSIIVLLPVIGAAFALVMAIGSISVLISIRHALIDIRNDGRNRAN